MSIVKLDISDAITNLMDGISEILLASQLAKGHTGDSLVTGLVEAVDAIEHTHTTAQRCQLLRTVATSAMCLVAILKHAESSGDRA